MTGCTINLTGCTAEIKESKRALSPAAEDALKSTEDYVTLRAIRVTNWLLGYMHQSEVLGSIVSLLFAGGYLLFQVRYRIQ